MHRLRPLVRKTRRLPPRPPKRTLPIDSTALAAYVETEGISLEDLQRLPKEEAALLRPYVQKQAMLDLERMALCDKAFGLGDRTRAERILLGRSLQLQASNANKAALVVVTGFVSAMAILWASIPRL